MASCPTCGGELPPESRFCPHCGRPADESGTRVLELPPDETGRVPVAFSRIEPRLYGVTPATLVLLCAAAALTLAIVLLVTGHWPLALILLGLAVLLLVLFVEAARRKPDGAVARTTADALDTFRARAGVAADSLATRGRATTRALTLRRELRLMGALRVRLLLELGDAVYRSDEQAIESARAKVEELDRLVAEREEEMQAVAAKAQDRITRRRLEVQPTEMVELPDESPSPGEVAPPEPAVIPEPYPPPDEANPPQPAIIPEPEPAIIPEPGPQARSSDEERR